MKALYDGFDLVAPSISVPMTINGPAPTVLALFLNTVIDQQVDESRAMEFREPTADERAKLAAFGGIPVTVTQSTDPGGVLAIS